MIRFLAAALLVLAGCSTDNPNALPEEPVLCDGLPCCSPPELESIVCPAGSSLVGTVEGGQVQCQSASGPTGTTVYYNDDGQVAAYGDIHIDWLLVSFCNGPVQMMVLTSDGAGSACTEECYQPHAQANRVSCTTYPRC